MQNQVIARPYAKALFEHARLAGTLTTWSLCLSSLVVMLREPKLIAFLKNPKVSLEAHITCLSTLLDALKIETPTTWKAFITLLFSYKRLFDLPAIQHQFEMLKAAHDQTLTVSVTTLLPLTASQRDDLVTLLSQRFDRKVTLDESCDASLLGGLLIRAGHEVIDASIRGQLKKLAAALVA